VGIIPGGGGSQRWPRLIGKAKALEWMLKGNQLTPQEAKEMGILTDVFTKAEFGKQVQAFADLMALRPPVAVHALKGAVHRGRDTFFARGLSLEQLETLRCFDTRDVEKAMGSYARILEEKIDVPQKKRMDWEEFIDTLVNARFVDGFEGK